MNNKFFFLLISIALISIIVGEFALRHIATSIVFDQARHELMSSRQMHRDVKEIYFPFITPMSLQTDQDRICYYCFRDIYLDRVNIVYTASSSFEDADIYYVQRECLPDFQCVPINNGEYVGIITENTENIDREFTSSTDCLDGVSLIYRYRYCLTTKVYNNIPVFKLISIDFEAHKFDVISHTILGRSTYTDEFSIYVDIIAKDVFERHFSKYTQYPLNTVHGEHT